ncbi:MAG: hypothetical protein R3A49_08375 [Acidimicrobiia bacterium]
MVRPPDSSARSGAADSILRAPRGLVLSVALLALLTLACLPAQAPAPSHRHHRPTPPTAPPLVPPEPPSPPAEDPVDPPEVTGTTYYVAPTGSDAAAGTIEAPFRTVEHGLRSLVAGDLLLVRQGTYNERIQSPPVASGSASEPIHVRAYPGERPVVSGLLWMKDASHWHISGLNVTWGPSNSASEHMVKFTNGTGWVFSDSEVWGARSYAAILVAGNASDWTITGNYVHDTYPANGTNQDHLIYTNSGTGGGVIERNLLVGSANGRAVKIGPPSAHSGVVENVTVRYNTMFGNTGPSNIQLAWGSSNNEIYGNIMVRPAPNRSNVTAFELTGSGNVVHDNLGWEAPRIADASQGLVDGGGNVMADPQLAGGDLVPQSSAAQAYGHLA